jgi:uncharacterized membrane protein YagU involved in acid resistance
MTAAMILMHRRLPQRERYPLPPREITMKLAREVGVEEKLDAEERSAVTMISHFAYGAAGGALYAAALEPTRKPLAKGVLFGLGVWAVSYLGWLPAAGVLSSATEHPARRNALMIAAHVVWGAVMGTLLALLVEESDPDSAEPFSAERTPHRDLPKGRKVESD